jgi:short-subunit dehydrogenase
MSLQTTQRKTALITGASSGIGRALAEVAAAQGFDVLALARRRERLEELCADLEARFGINAEPIVADLAKPETPREVARKLDERGCVVDVLINNAAVSCHGDFLDIAWEQHAERLPLVINAILELTHRLVPGMVERGWGRVINVGSVAGTMTGLPGDVLYAATKAMLMRFSEGLNMELKGTGVTCTLSLPGFTDTEIFIASGYGDIAARPGMRRMMMRPETVARQAFDAAIAGRPVVTHGISNKLYAAAMWHLPLRARRRLAAAAARSSQRLEQP